MLLSYRVSFKTFCICYSVYTFAYYIYRDITQSSMSQNGFASSSSIIDLYADIPRNILLTFFTRDWSKAITISLYFMSYTESQLSDSQFSHLWLSRQNKNFKRPINFAKKKKNLYFCENWHISSPFTRLKRCNDSNNNNRLLLFLRY